VNRISEEQTDLRSLNGRMNSGKNGHARMGELMVSILRDGQELVDRPREKGRCLIFICPCIVI
jgi:hypothetical protein